MNSSKQENGSGSGFWAKMLFLVIAVAAVGIVYWQFGQFLELDYLAKQEANLKAFQQSSPVVVFGLAFLVYVAVTGLSLPGAALLSLVVGWYFGMWQGVIFVSFAATTGATVAFLLSRFFFRDAIQKRFAGSLQKFNSALEREGAFYLFTLRLIPAVPFFVINAVMGLTTIRTWTFWWVSQLGMLPGSLVYIYAGSRVPSLQTLAEEGIGAVFTASQLTQITVAFVLLGTFPLLMKWLLKLFRPQSTATP